MKKSKVYKAIKDSVRQTYGKSGYTNTADKMLKLFKSELDKLYRTKKTTNNK